MWRSSGLGPFRLIASPARRITVATDEVKRLLWERRDLRENPGSRAKFRSAFRTLHRPAHLVGEKTAGLWGDEQAAGRY